MRLIDAKKLKREIKSLCNPYGKPNIGFEDGKKSIDLIDRQPTVEAVPVRHGHWEMEKDGYRYMMVCSECSEGYLGMPETNFRPHCGAKMDGGEE